MKFLYSVSLIFFIMNISVTSYAQVDKNLQQLITSLDHLQKLLHALPAPAGPSPEQIYEAKAELLSATDLTNLEDIWNNLPALVRVVEVVDVHMKKQHELEEELKKKGLLKEKKLQQFKTELSPYVEMKQSDLEKKITTIEDAESLNERIKEYETIAPQTDELRGEIESLRKKLFNIRLKLQPMGPQKTTGAGETPWEENPQFPSFPETGKGPETGGGWEE